MICRLLNRISVGLSILRWEIERAVTGRDERSAHHGESLEYDRYTHELAARSERGRR